VSIKKLIGSDKNQVPLNRDLGSLAYRNVVGIQANSNPAPTIASAATIEPQTPVVFVSGTTNVVNISVPPEMVGGGQLTIIPTGVFATTTAGNIALATTAVVSRALIMTYDRTTNKWYPSY
jgi:hypothetical protein